MEDIDWFSLWNNSMDKVFSNFNVKHDSSLSGLDASRDYDRAVSSDDWAIGRMMLDMMEYDEGSSILDIGCGPGTLTVPLSSEVKSITAIDPSKKMLSLLKGNLSKENAGKVTTINKAWNQVDVERDLGIRHDVVVSSFSIMENDLRAALSKFHSASDNLVYIFWNNRDNDLDRELSLLWEDITGKEHVDVPKSDIIYNALLDLDIYPNIKNFRMQYSFIYDSFKDLVNSFKVMYGCVPTDSVTDKQLIDFLDGWHRHEDEKHYIDFMLYTSMIWWDVHEV